MTIHRNLARTLLDDFHHGLLENIQRKSRAGRLRGSPPLAKADKPQSAALFTENQAAQLVAQPLRLFGIARGAKAFGKVEKCLLSLFPRFDAQLNEFHQDTVIAQTLALGHTIYLFGNWSGEGHAPSDMFCHRHGIIIHQFGALYTSPLIRKECE